MPDLAALVEPTALADFPGAPFASSLVASASASIREETEWHIAPSVTETLVVDSSGGAFLFLPTMWLTEVTEVRDVTVEDAPVVLTGWRSHATARFRAGVLERPGGWPYGVVEVDVTHGYESCPADLLPAIAARCQRSRINQAQGSLSLGSLSISNASDSQSAQADAVVARFRIPARA